MDTNLKLSIQKKQKNSSKTSILELQQNIGGWFVRIRSVQG